MPLIYQNWIVRDDLQRNPDVLYVFGDNVQRTGLGGQAKEMRGEPNAVGIPTKWAPSLNPRAFFYDRDRDQVHAIWIEDFKPLFEAMSQDRIVIWPASNIGTGLSSLRRQAPQLWDDLQDICRDLAEAKPLAVPASQPKLPPGFGVSLKPVPQPLRLPMLRRTIG